MRDLESRDGPVTMASPGSSAGRHGVPVPVKVVIAGGLGVGKTTMVGAISEIEPLTTEGEMTEVSLGVDDAAVVPHKKTTTVAMDFGRITLDRGSIVLYLFGTPGQDRFSFIWDELVTGAIGAIVVVDTRRLEACFGAVDYFEQRDIPFVVAVNTFDGELHHDLDDVRQALHVNPGVRIVATDARSREGVKTALIDLLDAVVERATAAVGART